MEPNQTEDHGRLHAWIRGLVQGVSFRWYTRGEASGLGVTGWVRNLPDGSVELVAEGERRALEDLLAWCRRGPEFSDVQDVQTRWEQATGEFSDFSIRH